MAPACPADTRRLPFGGPRLTQAELQDEAVIRCMGLLCRSVASSDGASGRSGDRQPVGGEAAAGRSLERRLRAALLVLLASLAAGVAAGIFELLTCAPQPFLEASLD